MSSGWIACVARRAVLRETWGPNWGGHADPPVPSCPRTRRAVLREYVGSQYEATLTNQPAMGTSLPAGVSTTAWVRWSFLSNLT